MSISNNFQVINVNGLNKKYSTDSNVSWFELDKWINEQEKYFNKIKLEDEEDKIHFILTKLDVRHFGKLQNFFKYNQHEPTYAKMKHVLLTKIKQRLDPTMTKYDAKVDGYIDKINIVNLDLDKLKTWLKKLRFLCDGQAKDDYLTIKIISRITCNTKAEVLTNLLREIKESIEIYESRQVNGSIGKDKKKELNSLKVIKTTVKDSLKFVDYYY